MMVMTLGDTEVETEREDRGAKTRGCAENYPE